MSRLTKPSVIFRERVVPAYANYLNHPLSEHHANNLAEVLNNTVEWTYLYLDEVDPSRLNGASLASFRTRLLTEHRALHVMSDLADAAQHRELTFERKPARVTLSRSKMQVEDRVVDLSPGMAVTVEIKTGSRTIISYLLSPLLRYKQEALRER